MTVDEFIRTVSICRRTFYYWRDKHPEIAVKIEGRVLVNVSAVEELIRQNPHRKKTDGE